MLYNYQIKFVIGSEPDFNEINEILSKIGSYDKSRVLIMPLASSRNQLFKIQKKGRAKRARFTFNHKLEKKAPDRKRGHSKTTAVSHADTKNIKKMIGA